MRQLSEEVQTYLDQLVREAQLPSFAIAVGTDDQEVFAFGGTVGTEASAAPTPDSRYAVYSVTKSVTALAALRLAASGCLNLEAPVGRYLDGWVEPSFEPVRIMHLLTHTAGFTYGSRSGPVAEAYRQAGFIRRAPRAMEPRKVYATFARLPRLYQPGAGWSYSLASDVLGWVLAEACGRPLADVLRCEVFGPLAMPRTCLFGELEEGHDVTLVYEHGAAGWQPAYSAMSDWARPEVPQSGGAAMVSTLRDTLRLAAAYCQQNVSFLPSELWRYVNINQLQNAASLRSGVQSALPGRTVDGVGYAAGVAVVFDGAKAGIPASLGEIGWEGSTGCFFFANPKLGIYAAFMTNVYPNNSMPWWLILRNQIYAARDR